MKYAWISIIFLILAAVLTFSGCPSPTNSNEPKDPIDTTDPADPVDPVIPPSALFSVEYNGNGNTGGSVPVDRTLYASSAHITILGNTGNLERTGLVFAGWNTAPEGKGTFYASGSSFTIDSANAILYALWIPNSRTFSAIDASTVNAPGSTFTYYDCPSTLLAMGEHCAVYAEDFSTVTPKNAAAIADEFDRNIFGKIQDGFGKEADVDANGRVILLLLDIKDGYKGTGAYAAGYFIPLDQFAKITEPKSNECDMLYIDIYPSEVETPKFYQSIAHEFQHLINWSQTFPVTGTEQDTWINEGLSSGAEYMYAGTQIQWKIDYYNEDPAGTIRKGNNFFVWYGSGSWEDSNGDGFTEGDVLANYATVYMFFQWLQIHAGSNTGIYKAILSSTHRDYKSVTEAASAEIDVSFGDWATLLGTWMTANILSTPSGFTGYGGQIAAFQRPFGNSGDATGEFNPGEGVYSMKSNEGITPPEGSGQNIRYIGIDSASGVMDWNAPYEGDMALVLNANTNIAGEPETGYISGSGALVAGSIRPSVMSSLWALPSSGPVDFQFPRR